MAPVFRGIFAHILGAGLALAGPLANVGRAAEAAPVLPVSAAALPPPEPATAALPSGRVALAVPEDRPDMLAPAADYGPLGVPCGARFRARPGPGGTAVLRVDAPCHPDAPVTIAHGALSASFRTSLSGVLETVFPAFEDAAEFRVSFADGESLLSRTYVPGAAGYERMVTMWQGGAGLWVHAFEYGAGAGDAGHVWRGAPRGARAAEAGRGGFLLELGNEAGPRARRAEVYSFPAAGAARSGAVRIALSAPVTPATCGRALEAETLQIGDGLPGAPVAIRIALPACDAEGGDMLLKNLARDLKIAAQ